MSSMRLIISGVAYLIFLGVYFSLLRYSRMVSQSQGMESFVVRFPKILDWSARICVLAGLIFGIIFFIQMLTSNSNITFSHFLICLVFICIGIFIEFAYQRWRINVQGTTLIFNRLFKQEVSFDVNDLDQISLTDSIIKISIDGLVITLVDKDADNYEKLIELLQEYGKVR